MNVLIHIGLPKTATTTLQKHLFLSLHNQGVVNFLGRCSTRNESDYYNPVEKVMNGIVMESDRIYNSKKNIYKNILHKLMRDDVLNVISEEAITLPRKNYDAYKVFKRIGYVFEGYNVKFIVFLRCQADLIYSYYVEMYRWRFFDDIKNNTFEKYSNNIRLGLDSYESHLYDYVGLIRSMLKYYDYDRINVLLFEQFVNEKEFVLKKMASILGVSYEFINELVGEKRENAKKKINGCYVSDDININQYFSVLFKKMLKYKSVALLKRCFYDSNVFYVKDVFVTLKKNYMKNIVIRKGVAHRNMSQSEKNMFKNIYVEKNLELCELLRLNKETMSRCGYI